ncbi:unnamed protein product [Bodo saltans]|uniref:Uncharacterized protein n=1 Tax=Bodo saltans TaxID=75058 RepID=A0A0S4J7H6_BODSA|nr:unnamed protein product [Bodo saltans]|eukprot:CUG76807.1 unnamed protein product [Bodo saltans]
MLHATTNDPIIIQLREEYLKTEYYFSKEFLESVHRANGSISRESRIELTSEQLATCVKNGVIEKGGPKGIDSALRMIIFCVPEVEKKRWRIIMWTVDINNFATEIIEVSFTPLEDVINYHLNHTPHTSTADSAAAYNQFVLAEEVRD